MLFGSLLLSFLTVPAPTHAVGLGYDLGPRDGTSMDAYGLAEWYLQQFPILDMHIDVPEVTRDYYIDNIDAFDLNKEMPQEFDIPRARKGHLGGMFWSVWTTCKKPEGPDFNNATWAVRDSVEQFDVALELIDRYSDTFKLCRTADEVEQAMREGKIASLIGVEGGHQLGNTLATLRLYHRLGMRYLTITHSCNNAFGDSGGGTKFINGTWGGLSPFGYELVKELNRLGVMADLSHVSDKTALDVLSVTKAPVIWSHSNSRSFYDVARNVPDALLDRIGTGEGKVDGVFGVNFYPYFLADGGNATLDDAVGSVEYIANRIGRKHLAIGGDFDGSDGDETRDIEDVSKYPALIAALINKGWSQEDIAGISGKNTLRIMRGVEKVAREMRQAGVGPNQAGYANRTDFAPTLNFTQPAKRQLNAWMADHHAHDGC